MQYAIKFFITRRVFEAERSLYQDSATPLGKFLPEVSTHMWCRATFKNIHLAVLSGTNFMVSAKHVSAYCVSATSLVDVSYTCGSGVPL